MRKSVNGQPITIQKEKKKFAKSFTNSYYVELFLEIVQKRNES